MLQVLLIHCNPRTLGVIFNPHLRKQEFQISHFLPACPCRQSGLDHSVELEPPPGRSHHLLQVFRVRWLGERRMYQSILQGVLSRVKEIIMKTIPSNVVKSGCLIFQPQISQIGREDQQRSQASSIGSVHWLLGLAWVRKPTQERFFPASRNQSHSVGIG